MHILKVYTVQTMISNDTNRCTLKYDLVKSMPINLQHILSRATQELWVYMYSTV